MKTTPIVYSCSGCSSAAQLANHLAIRLDRLGVAEMSCVAGLGGDVAPLVRIARGGRPIVALDGCPLRCVRACLDRHDLQADLHVTLTELGVIKRQHMDFDREQADELLVTLRARIEGLGAADRRSA